MGSSYFNREYLDKRVFCFYGNTNDLFMNGLLFPMTMDQALHQELKSCGYRRIIYYTLDRGAYFYDQDSRRQWDGTDEQQFAQDMQLPFADEPVFLPVAPIQSRIRLSLVVSSEEMIRAAMMFMRETEIPTAIVFPNATEVLGEFRSANRLSLLDRFFKSVTGASLDQIGNKNIVIFLFNRSLSEADAFLRETNNEAAHKYLMDSKVTTSRVLPAPNALEIRRMLNYLRLRGISGKRLMVNCAELESISLNLAFKLRRNMTEDRKSQNMPDCLSAVSLNDLINFLNGRFICAERILDKATCEKLCGSAKKSAMDRLQDLIGMDRVKLEIRRILLNSPRQQQEPADSRLSPPVKTQENQNGRNLHIGLIGNSGTGKTTVAALLGEIFAAKGLLSSGHLVAVNVADLKDNVVGGSEAKTRQKLEEARGGVLFLDEAYELARDDEYSKSILTLLVADMEAHRGEYALVLAGYKTSMEPLLNAHGDGQQGLAGRLTWIEIPDYTPDELTCILVYQAQQQGYDISKELKSLLPAFFERWYYDVRIKRNWANAREARNLLEKMIEMHLEMTGGADRVLTVVDIPEDYRKYTSAQAEMDAEEALMAMVGQQSVKEEICRIIRRAHFQGYFSNGVGHEKKLYVFEGNAGTGKTTVARLMGRMLRKVGVLKSGHLVEVRASDLISGYKGGTYEKAKKYFEEAIDGVLFIDEAYTLTSDLNESNDYTGAVINLIMEYIDNRNICLICAGYAKEMEGFLNSNKGLERRATRIQFEPYSPDELMQILRMRLADYTVDDGYYESARHNFEKYETDIARSQNGGYVNRYFKASQDMLFERLEKKYGKDKDIPETELVLKAEDAPNVFLM